MKRHLAASMILVGLAAAQPALSADLPRRAAPVPYAPMMAAYNWTGFYIGGNLGYGWGDVSHDVTGIGRTQVFSPAGALLFDSGPVGGSAFSNKANIDGFVGGGQLGWNWQTSNWVWGIETDLQATGQKGDHSGSVLVPGLAIPGAAPLPAQTLFLAGQPQLNWFGTLRGRVGILPTDRWLLYVTGGLAYGDLEFEHWPCINQQDQSGMDRGRWCRSRIVGSLDLEGRISLHGPRRVRYKRHCCQRDAAWARGKYYGEEFRRERLDRIHQQHSTSWAQLSLLSAPLLRLTKGAERAREVI